MYVISKKVLLFSQVFGYLPLKYNCSSKGLQSLKFSPKVFVWSLVVVSLQTVVGGFTLYEKYKKLKSGLAAETKMNTTTLAVFLDIIPLNILAVVILTSSTKNYPRFIKMCRLIERANKNLKVEKNDNKIKLKIPLGFIFSSFLFGFNTVYLIMIRGKILEPITFRAIHIAEVALLIHFSQAVQNIADLFRAFNNRFKRDIIRLSFGQLMTNHSLPDIEYTQMALPTSQSNLNLNHLIRVYWLLHQAKTQANLFYGSQLLFVIFFSFLHSTLSFYYSFLTIWRGFEPEELPGILLQVSWAVAHYSYIALLVWPSNDLTVAANETAQIVCQLANRDLNPELKVQMDHFLLQLFHHNTSITAMGFFPVQKQTLISIAGTVTTYLVIMIQFQINKY